MSSTADDRHLAFLRYDELHAWIAELAADFPDLITTEVYGRSGEGRDLVLVTVTDASTGSPDTKPAHWVDASIHAVELTATVAACALLRHLVDGFGNDPTVTRALQTRTFYVVPRVNPDGAEWVLADRPRHPRSATRPWPWLDGHRWPGLEVGDVDGDGRVLQMRVEDPDGGWTTHADEERLLVPIPAAGLDDDRVRYRLFSEGSVEEHDGFTVPTPRPVASLDLNRNFPAGWGATVPGSGDHPLSEPEIDALVRAIVARPNICGGNAFHTSGGVLLRPSSTMPDEKLPPLDRWVWEELAAVGTGLTGYPAHSVYEDFTWDRSDTMSGAADDWMYEHLGVFAWTTEFWDIIERATGTKQSTHFWYVGPTDDEALAVLRWCDANHPDGFVDWYEFEHPALGPVELGGWDSLTTWTNPPGPLLGEEVEGHAAFAVHQALCAPELSIRDVGHRLIGDDTWQITVGVANLGWLPTDVSARGRADSLTLPITVEVAGVADGALDVLDGPARRQLGQLEGRAALRFRGTNDGTPDRHLERFVIRAPEGTTLRIRAVHPRAGADEVTVTLD